MESTTIGEGGEEGTILQFLDSMDNYLTLSESISSTLRQGWMDLASARHSMGPSRISTALFDLKDHQAATVVQVHDGTSTATDDGGTSATGPQYALLKWGSSQDRRGGSFVMEEDTQGLRHRALPGRIHEETQEINHGSSPTSVDDNVQKERSKALGVFGALVSPKLRSTQASFETVLETLVDIANARSMMLTAFNQLQ